MRLSRRVLVVLALQAIALGVLATSALGTSKDGPQISATPQISVATDAAHDTTTGALADATVVPNDPNRTMLEFERNTPATVSPQVHDPVLQSAVSSIAVPGTSGSFAGLKRTDLNSGWPPDTVGDVGPTQYVQATNGGIAVFSKTGDNLTGSITDGSFWSGLPNCETTATRGLSDPTINYDQYSDRWVYGELSYDVSTPTYQDSYMCVAVSTTGDATGTWNRYAFLAGSSPLGGALTDYPKLGVWPDGYYISFNDFNNAGPHGFVGAGAMVLERSAMLAGSQAQSVFLDLRGVSGLTGGMLPSDGDGATPPANTPNYFISPVDDVAGTNDQMGIWAFHVDWAVPGNSTFTNTQALPVAAFDQGFSVPQPAPGSSLDGLADNRMMNRLQYRNFGTHETLVVNETVKGNGLQNAVRWYEFRKPSGGSWLVNQQSTFNPDSTNRWMGSVAMDGAGNMALGYTAADAATNPSLRYTGRLAGDPLSTMQAEATLVAGGGVQTGTPRWGDYSQMSVDPTDDCTFWYTGEYYSVTSAHDWETRVGSFRFPSCVTSSGPTYSVVPAVSGTLREGNTLSATAGTWSPALTSTSYQWRRCDSNSVACIDIPNATASTYVLQAADAGYRLRVKVTVSAATGTSSIVSASTGTILPLAPVNIALPSVTGTIQVAQVLTAAVGTWSTYPGTPNSYTYSWQRCTPGCADIGQTTSSYTLTASDNGATMRVGVTAHTIGGQTGPSYSAQTSAVTLPPPPSNTVAPTITGTAQDTRILVAQLGSWSGVTPIAYTYQWQSCSASGTNCTAISGQTSATYTVGSGYIGSRLRVTVTANNAGGASSVNTAVTSVVVPLAPANATLPLLSGSANVGAALVTTDGTWTGSGPIAYTYQWQFCTSGTCLNIVGATGSRLDVTSAWIGTTLRAVVTATNSGGSTAAYSGATVSVPTPVAGIGGVGAAGSGGGGGGGGGGTGGALDLTVTGYQTPANPLPGDNVTYVLAVDDLTPNQLAQNVYLNISLPPEVSYLTSTADRGSGCTVTSSTQLRCYLDFLSGQAPRANLLITAKVVAAGTHTLAATATAQQSESSLTNNTLTLTYTSGAGTTTSGAPVGLNGDGTPTKKQDKKKPSAKALYTSGARGAVAKLRFKIYDDQGVAKALTTIKRGATVVGTAGTGYGPVAYGSVYYVGWHVPAHAAPGSYWFCVTAVDRAGNKSPQSCAPLALK